MSSGNGAGDARVVESPFRKWERPDRASRCTYHEAKSMDESPHTHEPLLTDGILPDPFTLKDGWVGEEAISNWPKLSVMDIAEYLKETTTHDIYRKLMNEYKLGKAYRYFKSRHVNEVHFHSVDMKVPVAFLSVRVTPTMRSKADYQVWAQVEASDL